jgi:single-strand DNA-binding protein
MHMTGLARLGCDIEVRYTQDGKPVGTLALAFNYGQKGQDGNRPTQWVEASLWGERAEKLSEYLTKGTQISVILSEPHIQTYERRDGGQGFKLVARVIELQFAGGQQQEGRQQESQQRRAPAPAPRPAPAPKPAASTGFDDMDDDIPF